ncbi:MAG: hypothetical protein CMJ78_17150 [Planctomycetaceae bacterium]|nr:hypothetical protein [Planctomycetaceae bacterium]
MNQHRFTFGGIGWAVVFAICCVDASSAIAQDSEEEAKVFLNSYASRGGVNCYSRGTWGLVNFEVINPTDQPQNVLTVSYFEGSPHLQFGRRVWLPAHSKLRSWYPVRPPESRDGSDASQFEIRTLLIDESNGADTIGENADDRISFSGVLDGCDGSYITALISGTEDPEFASEDVFFYDPVYEMAVATRQAERLSRKFAFLDIKALPKTAESLNRLDQLILGGDLPYHDSSGIDTIRRWLHNGGQLWIMLDQVSEATVSQLLGDTLQYEVVDRVDLTSFQIKHVENLRSIRDGENRSVDEPVEFVRVIVEGAHVIHRIGEWPAAFEQRIGKGRVIVTTLGPHGWLRDWREGDTVPENAAMFAPTNPLDTLAEKFYIPRDPDHLPPEEFTTVLSDQIGYQVAGRTSIALVLGSFCGVLFLVGLWLIRTKRLDRLAWLAPISATIATVAVLLVGSSGSDGIPNTTSVGQFVEAVPRSEDFSVHGMLALYNNGISTAPASALRGGVFLPTLAGMGGETRRMIWMDANSWEWNNMSIPPGIQTAPFMKTGSSNSAIEAVCSFGPTGLSGKLYPGPFAEFEDAVVASSAKDCSTVRFDDEGRFAITPTESLARGQYVSGTLLTDEQRRRQSVYDRLIPGPNLNRYPNQPTLFAWTDPLPTHFSFPDEKTRTHSTLLAIPLSIERSRAGTSVIVPPPFLPFKAVLGPDEQGSFLAFDNRKRTWLATKGSLKVWLRFQLPDQVLPMKLDGAVIHVHINGGPLSALEIQGTRDNQANVVTERADPVGTVRFEIDDMSAFEVDPQGGVTIGLNILTTSAKSNVAGQIDDGTNKWQIDYVQLQLNGTTSSASESD